MKHLLSKMDTISSVSELSKSVDILEAIYFVKSAWQQVSPTTIKNCFAKAGFKYNGVGEEDDQFTAEDDLPLSIIAELCKSSGLSDNSTEDFINIDDNLATEDDVIDVERQDDGTVLEIQSDDEDMEELLQDVDDSNGINSYEDALKVVAKLKLFAKRNDDFAVFELTKSVEMHLENVLIRNKRAHSRQTTLLEYFNTKN